MMKKLLTLAIIVLFSLAIISVADAARTWKKSVGKDDKGDYEVYQNRQCYVTVYKESKIVYYSAWDVKQRKTYHHTGTIRNGIWTENLMTYQENSGTSGYGDYFYFKSQQMQSGYHVFNARCTSKARHLPADVRALFNGILGVK
jgi:hypothetical protein